MQKKFILGALIVLSSMQNHLNANCCDDCDCYSDWYATVSAGYAWSLNASIDNPNPSQWDAATQGYDSDLGNSPFFTISLGKSFCNLFYVDLGYSYYQTFHYQKYQTGVSATPGFSGSARTRFFDLDHQNVLANFSFCSHCFSYDFWCMNFTPFIGVGLGVGINRVNNFHTVAFVAIDDLGVGTNTTIGNPHTRASFAWQATAGIQIQPKCCSAWSFDIGYHYYDGGTFEGPSSVIINTFDGIGTFLEVTPWKGKLKANEVFLTINYKI